MKDQHHSVTAGDQTTADQGVARWFGGMSGGSIGSVLSRMFIMPLAVILVAASIIIAGIVIFEGRASHAAAVLDADGKAGAISSDLLVHQELLGKFVLSGDHSDLSKARDMLGKAQEHARALETVTDRLGDASGRNAGQLAERLAELDGRINALADKSGDRVVEGAVAASRQTFAIADEVNRLRDGFSAEQLHDQTVVGKVLDWVFGFVVLLAIVAVGCTVYALRMTRRRIVTPLEQVSNSMVRLADGARDIEVPDLARQDEIGDLARSLDVFHRAYFRLEKLRDEATKASEVELERQKEIQLERERMHEEHALALRDLADQFETTVGEVVGSVASASTQLQATASSMASAAEQSSHQTSAVSKNLAEASASVTAAAAACDEFAMSIGEISRQAASSAELARTASGAASEADATISALSESAVQIGQIVEMISSIAQRTNLLALNASIEAARGGEAGRGFPVVAAEVKELANQTGKATDEVAARIRTIQDSTTASVAALRSIGHQIQQLEATSVSIASAVDQQSVAGQDLSRSIDLAAHSADDVASNIVQVRETSLATGTAATQVLSSSTELEQQAARLQRQVDQFLSHVRAA